MAACDGELAEDARHVLLQCLDRDEQPLGGLPVRVAASDQIDHLPFPGRQSVDWRIACDVLVDVEQEPGNVGRNRFPAGRGLEYQVYEILFAECGFGDVSIDSSMHHLGHVLA